MKLKEFAGDRDKKIMGIIESASGGSTSAGSIASVANPMGAINRRPSLFGYIPQPVETKRKKTRKSK